MTSRSARRRKAKHARAKGGAVITLPGGDVLAQKPDGRDRRRTNQPKEDPMQTVIAARRRMMGDLADEVDLRSAMVGDELGRAILKADCVRLQDGTPDSTYSAAVLWDAITHMRRTVAAYDRACGAPARHPKCLSILTPPDRLEATAESPAFDDRPEADRSRAAVSAYMALQGWLAYCDAAARSACLRAVVDDTGVNDLPGIILALQCVVDGHAGRKIVWRGRDGR